MCGFILKYAFDGINEPELPPSVVATFQHRGPDELSYLKTICSETYFARLSIVDVHNGQQPIQLDENVYGFGNGEIYNYIQLANSLPSDILDVVNHSDIKVALQYLYHFGSEAIVDIVGMFSLVIVDEFTHSVTLFRDRVGEKPLYYAIENGKLLVSSTMSALIPLIPNLCIKQNQIQTWLKYGLLPTGETFFNKIFEVKPGTILTLGTQDSISEVKYWDWPQRGNRNPDLDFMNDYKECLINASAELSISDNPVSLALSSGLDSNLLLSLLQHSKIKPEKCFNLIFRNEKFNEVKSSKEETEFIEKIVFENYDSARLLELTLARMDTPISDPACLAFTLICSRATENYKVILTGDGGDELFRGYQINKSFKVANFIFKLLRKTPRKLRNRGVAILLTIPDRAYLSRKQKLIRLLIGSLQNPLDSFGVAIGNTHLSNLNQQTTVVKKDFSINSAESLERFFQKQNLPQVLLQKSDRCSMGVGIEARSLFLHADVIKISMEISPKWVSKKILKKIFLQLRKDVGNQDPGLSKSKRGLGVPLCDFLSPIAEPFWVLPEVGVESSQCTKIWSNRSRNPSYANLALSYLVLNWHLLRWKADGVRIEDE